MTLILLLSLSLHNDLISSTFTAKEVSNIETAEIADKTEVQLVAKLLGVDANRLYNGLTTKTIYTREEAVTSSLSQNASLDVRDAFVKVCVFNAVSKLGFCI